MTSPMLVSQEKEKVLSLGKIPSSGEISPMLDGGMIGWNVEYGPMSLFSLGHFGLDIWAKVTFWSVTLWPRT